MDSNTHSSSRPDRLGALAAAVDELAAEDLDGLADAALAEQVLRCGGSLTASKASGCEPWPRWTPAAPPAPSRASRPAPPPPGSGTGCA